MVFGFILFQNSSFLLIFLLINLSHQYERVNIFNSTSFLPYSLTLLNKENILVINNGIHFFDEALSEEYSTKYIPFETVIDKNDKDNFGKINIVQFSEEDGKYILVLAYDKMYFITYEYDLLTSIDLSSNFEHLNSKYYSLIPYKKADNSLHYIISQINSAEKSFTLYYWLRYFTFKLYDHSNTLSNSKNINAKVQNYDAYSLDRLSCLFITDQSLNKDLLTCFYHASYPYEIQSRVFDPDDFEEKTEYFKELQYDYQPSYLNAITNNSKQKAFIILIIGCIYKLSFDFNNFFSSVKN